MTESEAERLEAALNGKEIARLMANPGYDAAVKAVRDAIVDTWSRAQSTTEREQAWHMLQALDYLQVGLKAYANNGTLDHFKASGRL